jgi:hypothetical protein
VTDREASLASALRQIVALARKALAENKVPKPPGRGDHFTAAEQKKILKWDGQRMSARKIALLLGRSQPGVSHFLRKNRGRPR